VDILVIHLFNALLYASVLFLIAGGLSLIYGVMRIVNLAHGNLYALGAFITASVVGQWFAGSNSAWLFLLLPTGALGAAAVGAILEPTLRDLVLVPMNPFALTVRPIVFPPGQQITLSVVRGPGEMRIDGRRGRAVATGDSVRCGSHPRRLKVVRFSPPEEFYRRLGDKLGWGRPLVPKN